MDKKLDKIVLDRTSIHEVGHGIFYVLNEWEFYFITIRGNKYARGYIRPTEFESLLWIGLVHNYYNKPKNLKLIKQLLKQHIEICIAGDLCALYFEHKHKDKAFNDLFEKYDFFFSDMEFCNIIDDLIFTRKVPDTVNKRKKVRIFAGFNPQMMYNSDEYAEIDQDFIDSYLALSLFYNRNNKLIKSYYKRTAKRVLNIIEEKFELVESLATVLRKKKQLSFEQFYKLFLELK